MKVFFGVQRSCRAYCHSDCDVTVERSALAKEKLDEPSLDVSNAILSRKELSALAPLSYSMWAGTGSGQMPALALLLCIIYSGQLWLHCCILRQTFSESQ